jgi:hypothetical protein
MTTLGTKEKAQRTKNDLQNTKQKTKEQAMRTPLKTGVNSVFRFGVYICL